MTRLLSWFDHLAWFSQLLGLSGAFWAVLVALFYGTTMAFPVAFAAVLAMVVSGILKWVKGFLVSLNS